MNAGLGNLASLRTHLLPNTMQADTSFDSVLLDLGKGVAGLMNRYCNRKFEFMVGAQDVFTGDRDHYYLERFPITQIQQVNLRYFEADPWTDISGQPLSLNCGTGLLHFGYTLGILPIQVQVIWSGGYFFETLEPEDAGYPSQLPSAITEAQSEEPGALPPEEYRLPSELRLAWLLQCREVWNKLDKLGTGLVDKPDQQSLLSMLNLSDAVKETLRPYVRMQLQ